MTDNLLFLHIPKTAGTTLHTVIGRNYRERNCCTLNAIRWPDKLKNLDGKKKEDISMLKGHFAFGAHEYMRPGTFEYFTLLREPIDRTISHYHQVLRTKTHHFAEQMREKNYTLRELMESGDLLYVDNLQTRMISGDLLVPYGEVNEQTLAKAIGNLGNHFSFVGLQNRFDEFLLLLAEHYSWKSTWYRRQQIGTGRKRADELDDATIDAVKRFNRMDEKLYAYAGEHFEKLIAAKGNAFQEKVIRFQRKNANINSFIKLIPFFPAVRGD